MNNEKVKKELIKIAADIIWQKLPSDVAEDYTKRRYSATTIAKMMEKVHNNQKDFVYRIAKLSRLIG